MLVLQPRGLWVSGLKKNGEGMLVIVHLQQVCLPGRISDEDPGRIERVLLQISEPEMLLRQMEENGQLGPFPPSFLISDEDK